MAPGRTYRWILAGTIIAVVGLLAIQVVLIDMAYRAADKAFGQNVSAALQNVAQGLEAREMVMTVFLASDADSLTGDGHHTGKDANVRMKIMKGAVEDSCAAPFVMSRVAHPRLPGRTTHTVQIVRTKNGELWKETLLDTVQTVPVRTDPADSLHAPPGGFAFGFQTIGDSVHIQMKGMNNATAAVMTTGSGFRRALVSRVVDRLSTTDQQPIQHRVRTAELDSLLQNRLRENGITIGYRFGIAAAGEDTLRIAGPDAARAELFASPYRTRLFPADILAARNDLLVSFPGERWYLLRQVGPYAIATLLFAAFILWGFVQAFRTIARQERLSLHVRDFINNMVHEFKTPLSTITLAAEAMVRPDVIGQRTRIRRYADVIGEETARMRNGVSKILQMAVVEEGDYDLTMKPLDLHALLESVAAVFAVQVESRGGSITLKPDAQPAFVTADAMHLTNILHNVLENAVKYTPGTPAIVVTTDLAAATVTVRIADNGIGMSAAETERVFEKYYRVPTGNLHDVKGFGLGLAYVRMMITAMKGSVAIESAPGTGTTVVLTVPRTPEGAA